MAKSSKSSKDDKKQKSKDVRISNGQTSSGGVWVKRDSLKGNLVEGGAVRARVRDGSGSFTIKVEDGQVVVTSVSKSAIDRPALPAAEVLNFGAMEKASTVSFSSPDSGMLLGGDGAEFKAGIERMAKYHAKTKALFSSLIKANTEVVFSGALAGNVRKNKSKKRSGGDESVEIKKAH